MDGRRLIDAFAGLRVPRHLFKFMYRLFTAHCNSHSDENPVWQISSGTFESVLALYQRDQDAFDRGLGADKNKKNKAKKSLTNLKGLPDFFSWPASYLPCFILSPPFILT